MPILKKKRICLFAVTLLSLLFQQTAAAGDDCRHCGMRRADFGYSWMVIRYDSGGTVGVCSVHCAVIDMVTSVREIPESISVADYNNREQIDAEQAFWVIGGDRLGVMTARAKWAFSTQAAADEFVRLHGGQITDLEAVIQAAFEDMYQDVTMIQKKRRMMKMRKSGP